jgi:hypothetical protein
VAKVEKFLVDQIRRALHDRLVWPRYHTIDLVGSSGEHHDPDDFSELMEQQYAESEEQRQQYEQYYHVNGEYEMHDFAQE